MSDLKGDICIIFDALKKLEDSQNSEDPAGNIENGNSNKNLKLKRQYKKLEEAFRDLSMELY